MQQIGLILVLATLVEGMLEYFGARVPAPYKAYVGALVGVLVCLAYRADLLLLLGYPAQFPYAGEILTGLVVGRGSNYVNDLWELVRRSGRQKADPLEIETVVALDGDEASPDDIQRTWSRL